MRADSDLTMNKIISRSRSSLATDIRNDDPAEILAGRFLDSASMIGFSSKTSNS